MTDTPENVRPWGRYDVIDGGEGFQVKRITVNAGGRLSYQRHQKRAERWVIVHGVATVTIDDETTTFDAGEVVFVPLQAKHRLENLTETPLVLIEVQLGAYLGEDDIERFEDAYGRA